MCTLLCGTNKFSNKILNHSFQITCMCCRSLRTSPQCHFPIKHACKRRRTLRTCWTTPFTFLSEEFLPFHTQQGKQVIVSNWWLLTVVVHLSIWPSSKLLVSPNIPEPQCAKHFVFTRTLETAFITPDGSRELKATTTYQSNSDYSPFVPDNIILGDRWLGK
jgi:hypothetical protein